MPKYARRSFGDKWECQCPWPDNCFVQCGDNGIVLDTGSIEQAFSSNAPLKTVVEKIAYATAFFEAFPVQVVKDDSIFIRGEGKTILEAETVAWEKYQKYKACNHPEYERRGYKNGAGFCVQCGMFNGNAFDPLTKCKICGVPTYFVSDTDGHFYCKLHHDFIPEDKQLEWFKALRKIKSTSEEEGGLCI